MPVQIIDALTKLLHELGPWAGVIIAAIAAWQAKRAKDHGKENAVKLDEAKQELAVTKVEVKETQQKVAEVHRTVNGKMDLLVELTKNEAYQRGLEDARNQQRINEEGSR